MDASRFPATMRSPIMEGSMSLELLAIDLGKRSFHLYGIDADGVIVSRKVSRAKLVEAVQNLAPATVAMEACASAHHWGRLFIAAGCKERCHRRRGDLRGSNPANHALRPGKEHRTTGHSITASCARALG